MVGKSQSRIERCARDSPHVLTDPAPEVLLEDFGDNALVLSLYFWAELGGGRSMVQMDSEIWFAIEETLGRAAVVIAFPLRDLHVDVVKPTPVRWAADGEDPPGVRIRPQAVRLTHFEIWPIVALTGA